MTETNPDELLSVGKVAAMVGVNERTVRKWADEGLLKCQRTLGARGDRRFRRGDVEAAMKRE